MAEIIEFPGKVRPRPANEQQPIDHHGGEESKVIYLTGVGGRRLGEDVSGDLDEGLGKLLKQPAARDFVFGEGPIGRDAYRDLLAEMWFAARRSGNEEMRKDAERMLLEAFRPGRAGKIIDRWNNTWLTHQNNPPKRPHLGLVHINKEKE